MKEHYKQLYAHKLNKFDEIEQFLKNHKLLKFAQEEIGSLHNFISIKKCFQNLNLLKKEIFRSGWCQWLHQGNNLKKHIKEEREITSILHNLSQKTDVKGIFSNPFCEASITLRRKPHKYIYENYKPELLKNININILNQTAFHWIRKM